MLVAFLGWRRSLGPICGTIPCTPEGKVGRQLWCLKIGQELKRIAHNTTCRVSRIVKKKRQKVTVGKEILQIVVVERIVKLKKKRRIGKLNQKILSKNKKKWPRPVARRQKLRSLYRGFLFIRVCSNSRVVSIIHSDNQEKKRKSKKKYVKA